MDDVESHVVSTLCFLLIINTYHLFLIIYGLSQKNNSKLLHPQLVLCGNLKDFCAVRDNTPSCDIADNNAIVVLINDTCIN